MFSFTSKRQLGFYFCFVDLNYGLKHYFPFKIIFTIDQSNWNVTFRLIFEKIVNLIYFNSSSDKYSYRLISLEGRVFANDLIAQGSIPGSVIPKTLKMLFDTSLLNTQQYKVRINGKVDQYLRKE